VDLDAGVRVTDHTGKKVRLKALQDALPEPSHRSTAATGSGDTAAPKVITSAGFGFDGFGGMAAMSDDKHASYVSNCRPPDGVNSVCVRSLHDVCILDAVWRVERDAGAILPCTGPPQSTSLRQATRLGGSNDGDLTALSRQDPVEVAGRELLLLDPRKRRKHSRLPPEKGGRKACML